MAVVSNLIGEQIPWREHPIDVLDLSARSYNALRRAGVQTLGQLYDLLATGLIREVKNVGTKSCCEMREELNVYLAAIPGSELARGGISNDVSAVPAPSFEHLPWRERPIDVLGLSTRSYNALQAFGIRTIGQLRDLTIANSVERVENIGRKSNAEICKKLRAYLAAIPDSGLEGIGISGEPLRWRENPIKVLGLSVRSHNALRRFGIQTIGQLHDLVVTGSVLEVRNIGAKSSAEIHDRLDAYLAAIAESEPAVAERGSGILSISAAPIAQDLPLSEVPKSVSRMPLPQRTPDIPLQDRLAIWLSVLDARERQIIEWRYGPQSETWTLEAIGEQLGLTRERVRQLQQRCLKALARPGRVVIVGDVVEALRREMCSAGGLMTEEEVGRYIARLCSLEQMHPLTAGRLLLRISPCFEEVIKRFLWGLPTAPLGLVQDIHREMERVLEDASLPLSSGQVIACFRNTAFYRANQQALNDAFVAACLRTHPEIKQDADNRCVLKKWSKKRLDEIVQALYEIGRPAHFTIIAERANLLLPPDQRASDRTMRAYMERRTDVFIGLGRGMYWLRNHKVVDNDEEGYSPQSDLALRFDRLARWQAELDGRDSNVGHDTHTEVERIRQLGLGFFGK